MAKRGTSDGSPALNRAAERVGEVLGHAAGRAETLKHEGEVIVAEVTEAVVTGRDLLSDLGDPAATHATAAVSGAKQAVKTASKKAASIVETVKAAAISRRSPLSRSMSTGRKAVKTAAKTAAKTKKTAVKAGKTAQKTAKKAAKTVKKAVKAGKKAAKKAARRR